MNKCIKINRYCTFICYCFLSLSHTCYSQCTPDIGIYYWGGILPNVDSTNMISVGHKLADSLGVNTIRFTLACNDDEVYKPTNYCLTGMNLTALASRVDFNAIITDPQFTTIIITAYDWTSFGDCDTAKFLDTNFFTPANTSAIEKEYTNLANYLKNFPSKKFILTNWEADNQVYCGSAYYDPNCPSAQENMQGEKKWLMARAAGINAAGASNVKVGIEFCNIHSLEANGKPDVLDTIIPYVYSDYYLYSSYESINISPAQTDSDIEFIRQKLARFKKDSSTLLIGEMGFGKLDWGSDTAAANKLQAIINVLKIRNIPSAYVWTLLDNPNNFCAYDSLQQLTAIGQVVKKNACIYSYVNYMNPVQDIGLELYPNPANSFVMLKINAPANDEYTIEIDNVLGEVVYSENLKCSAGENEVNMKIDNFAKALYLLRITGSDGVSLNRKLVVE